MDANVASEPSGTKFLTVRQAARQLNISPSLVYRLCETRRLRHFRFGEGRSAIRVDQADLDEYVRRSRIDKTETPPQAERPARRAKPSGGYVFQRLDFRPVRACGATTKAGTPCPMRTRDERCHMHGGKKLRRADDDSP